MGFPTQDFSRQAIVADRGNVEAKEEEQTAKSKISHVDWLTCQNNWRKYLMCEVRARAEADGFPQVHSDWLEFSGTSGGTF